MADIFISYAREDADRAEVIAEVLTARGYTVFWDSDLRAGQSFRQQLDHEIQRAECVIVLWSRAALESDWVEAEALFAFDNGKLFSVILHVIDLPLPFASRQANHLVGWRGSRQNASLLEMIDDVEAFLDGEEETEAEGLDEEDDDELHDLVLEFLENNPNIWFNAARITTLSRELDYQDLAEYDSMDIAVSLENLFESGEIYRKRSGTSDAWLYSL